MGRTVIRELITALTKDGQRTWLDDQVFKIPYN
jgi:hypothetical protein